MLFTRLLLLILLPLVLLPVVSTILGEGSVDDVNNFAGNSFKVGKFLLFAALEIGYLFLIPVSDIDIDGVRTLTGKFTDGCLAF